MPQIIFIYKIQHEDKEELVYVGRTTNFIRQKNSHKNNCNKDKHKYKVYQMIRENGGWDCFKMTIIEEYPCENNLEACKRTDEHMKELKATMNSVSAVYDRDKRNRIKRENYQKQKQFI